MIRLLNNELFKILRLRKLYIFMSVTMAILLLQSVSFSRSAEDMTGQSFPLVMLRAAPQLVIVFMMVILADIVTDEYRNGTLKLSLLRSVDRMELLNAKIISFIVAVIALVLVIILGGYLMGYLFFGWGDHVIIQQTGFPPAQGLLVTLQAYAITLLPLIGFGMIILFVTLLFSNMGAALATSLGVMFVFIALENIEPLHPFSILHQVSLYTNFIGKLQVGNILVGIVNCVSYAIVFYCGSAAVFKRKDLLL